MGSGLGLNIVHRIIKMHHGEILAKSEPGKGSEFKIMLPLRQPEEDLAHNGSLTDQI